MQQILKYSILLSALLITLSFVSSKVSATETYSNTTSIKCDWCVSNYNFEVVATGLAKPASTQFVYILNFTSSEIRKYRVRQAILGNGHIGEPQVALLSVDSTLKNTFDAMSVERNVISDFFDFSKDVPPSVAGSVYDLVGTPSVVNDVADYYNANMTLLEAIGNYTALSVLLQGKLVGINYVVELSFSDGSSAVYKINGLLNGFDFQFEYLSGKDADNNNITLDDFPEVTYSFASQGVTGISTFVNAAAAYGTTVSVVYTNSSSSSTVLSCVFANNTLTCKKV
jgi:hypothetical protein